MSIPQKKNKQRTSTYLRSTSVNNNQPPSQPPPTYLCKTFTSTEAAQCISHDNEKTKKTETTNEWMCYHKKINLKRRRKHLRPFSEFSFAGCTSNMPGEASNIQLKKGLDARAFNSVLYRAIFSLLAIMSLHLLYYTFVLIYRQK